MAICEAPLPRMPLAPALLVLAVLSILKPSPPAEADEYDDARSAYPALFQTYYDEGLLEYCGLLTRESVGGFLLRRDDLLTQDPLTEEQHRRVRVAAGIAIDYQYDNHGLGGQRLWCKTAGRDAYNRFVGRYLVRPETNMNGSEIP
jgi:hypothetical protein